MPLTPVPAVTLTPVGYFPEKYFLENLAVRADGSVLITAVPQKELWCVPGPEPRPHVPPVPVHTFDHAAGGIVETEPDVAGPRVSPYRRRSSSPSTTGSAGSTAPACSAPACWPSLTASPGSSGEST